MKPFAIIKSQGSPFAATFAASLHPSRLTGVVRPGKYLYKPNTKSLSQANFRSCDMTHNPEQKRRKRHPIDFAHVRHGIDFSARGGGQLLRFFRSSKPGFADHLFPRIHAKIRPLSIWRESMGPACTNMKNGGSENWCWDPKARRSDPGAPCPCLITPLHLELPATHPHFASS